MSAPRPSVCGSGSCLYRGEFLDQARERASKERRDASSSTNGPDESRLVDEKLDRLVGVLYRLDLLSANEESVRVLFVIRSERWE